MAQDPWWKLQSYKGRIRTFTGASNFFAVNVEEFAKHRFYYIGPADRVRTLCCGIELEGWKKNDDIELEHAKRCEWERCPTTKWSKNYGMLCISNFQSYTSAQHLVYKYNTSKWAQTSFGMRHACVYRYSHSTHWFTDQHTHARTSK